MRQRGQEDIEHAALAAVLFLGLRAVRALRVAQLDAQRAARDPAGRLLALREGVGRLRRRRHRRMRAVRRAHARAFARPALALHRDAAALGEAGAGMARVITPVLPAQFGRRGQPGAWREQVLLDHVRVVGLVHPRQRIERQAVAHRRIAGGQVQPLVAHEPGAGDPLRRGHAHLPLALERQHVADHLVQPLREEAAQAGTLHLVIEPRLEGIDVDRQPALPPQVVPGVLVAWHHVFRVQAEACGQRIDEALGVGVGVVVRLALVGEQ